MVSNLGLHACKRMVLAALLAASGGWSSAAFADDLNICIEQSGDVALNACTRAIDSGKLSKQNLAVAYTSRGVEWRAKGEVDRAITDHTRAIAADAKQADAFYNRGNAYWQKKDLDRALADYDVAIRLNPRAARYFNNRGLVYKDKGDSARSEADAAEAKRLGR